MKKVETELVLLVRARYQSAAAFNNVGSEWVIPTPSSDLTDHTAVTDTKTIGFDFCAANPNLRRLLSSRLLRKHPLSTERQMLDSS